MNPDNDGTAIWLERKFNVPSSGRWVSENIFSMGLSPADPSSSTASSLESPGLIVFECTPLEGLDDDLEKKYRILDDCARLRDIILALPADRHYIPSLLLIVWTEGQLAEAGSELQDMVRTKPASSVVTEVVFRSQISCKRNLSSVSPLSRCLLLGRTWMAGFWR